MNDINKMTLYYTVTNSDETYYGYVLEEGLNICQNYIHNERGFCFTTSEFIHNYYFYGNNLRIVELPINDPNFKMCNIDGCKYISNMIILKEKYNFNNLKDAEKY